jgi:hypothetical protein
MNLTLWGAYASTCELWSPKAEFLGFYYFSLIFKSQLVVGVILIKVWRCGGKGLGIETPW